MFRSNRMQYVIKTCNGDDTQALQDMLNEMSMNGWELYSMSEIENEDGSFKYNCIFMSENVNVDSDSSGDVISIDSFKSQMEKMLSPQYTPYETCIDIQSKIANLQRKIANIKSDLEGEAPASINRKKLNDKISAGLKELDELKVKLSKATSPDVMFSRLKADKLSINLSEELLDYVNSEKDFCDEDLVAATVRSRLHLTDKLGFILPKVIFKDDEMLNPYEFSIKIRGNVVHKSCVYPEYTMFFLDDLHLEKKPKESITDVDAITGEKIIWIKKELTKDFWEKGISGSEYITRMLEYYSVKYVEDLMDYAEVDKYIDVVDDVNPFLVENIIPEYVSEPDLKYILTSLIKEKVSVKDIVYIFEKLNDYAGECQRADLLSKIRLALSKQICKSLVNNDGIILAFELSEKTFDEFMPGVEEDDNAVIKIDGDFAEKLALKISKKSKKLGITRPIVVVPMEMRSLFFSLLSNYLPDVVVISREEVGCNYPLEIISEI